MKLLYFTNSYPYGLGEQWKTNELKELVHHFEEVIVVPFSYGGNFNPKQLPEGVSVRGPLFINDAYPIKKKHVLNIFVQRNFLKFLKEFFTRKVYKKKQHLLSWFIASNNVVRLLKHPLLKQLLNDAPDKSILYFYWGKGSCEILPFIDTGRFFKTFVRMHRYDLFEYVNNNYIPYRGPLLNSTSIVAPSSLAGKQHLLANYPKAKASIEVIRCGTIGNGKLVNVSNDNILRVVSCSFLSEVKRVHLMIESLQYINFPIIWRHVGDGVLRKELELLVKRLGVEDKFFFEGLIQSDSILDYYTNNSFNLFINTSSSEGVPFSIMEAFSVGIPVMATNVGGTAEIVDDKCGKLLPADLNPKQLADELSAFYNKSPHLKLMLQKEAYNRYKKFWDAEKLAKELVLLLK